MMSRDLMRQATDKTDDSKTAQSGRQIISMRKFNYGGNHYAGIYFQYFICSGSC